MLTKGLGPKRDLLWSWGIAGAVFCFLFAGYLAASPQNAAAKQNVALRSSRPDMVFVQTSVLVPGPLGQRFPNGSRIVRLSRWAANGKPIPLTDGFFAAADPQINFAATKVLFSGQKSQGERWQIWEMDLDGSNKRQVTQGMQNCLRAAYLPANEIAFTVEDATEERLKSHLAVAKIDGSELHRITFGTAPFQLETVLRDGRIVASAPWPLVGAEKAGGSRLLYTLRPDGTALESFRCEHGAATIQAEAEELEDGSLVFVREARTETGLGGTLVRILQGDFKEKPVGARQAVYQSARQLSEEELLVSRGTRTSKDAARKFDLYALHLKTGTLGERIFTDPQFSSIQAVLVAPHALPKHYWNTLNPESKTGNFISLNSYLSADESRGHLSTPITQVRVITVNSSDGQERILGEAPVEMDGSFFVKVPANWPIRFVLLDAKNQPIREEHGWIWARPGEQRGCTGCHGDKAVAPENRWPLTLRRFDTPTSLGDIDHGSTTSQAK